ncbi:MAG TPA: DUF1206 domain-containing protein [Gaiellaceae bacterium]|nr:DUF1206 domain-containing protein [Gaiellaceae bacterium]
MTEGTERVAQSRWVERMGRFGLATKGFSYVLVAVIAIRVAVGGGGEAEDRQGALQTLADEPFGWALLLMVALGFAAYALWRFAEAIFDRGGEGDDAKGIGKRLADFGKGVLYAGLAVGTVSILVGSGGGGSKEEDKATAFALEWPGGRWIVGAVGVAIVGAGIFNAYRALSGSFRKELRTELMGAAEEGWYTALGVAGHLARAVVFALIGVFVVRAAWQYDPQEAIGLDEALQKLAGEAYGPFLLGVVALGLAAYGLFCIVQAKYRDV